ncbi:hypothetical protein DFA_08345 [Cavenderia fasciculata]|uniref:F-box domain-containing protein n=1 Tax=Cavenderia fasciculata TaxID=261658 RepID=F4Q5U1_CACFS|nr:uncharacterized protein DFA_08345 [Cavenderia fasciculata]EGG17350.1 hypothetical protein DFA_08345 [Cavenderia fasciculata]|eukprot:XP_004355834.1 hypothetical protein DFA_08345 [Cavenderia fasciculata]
MTSSLLSLSNLILLNIISSIQDNGDIICLMLTCKKLYQTSSSLRRSIIFKGKGVIPITERGIISNQFKTTATRFTLLSFKDILERSISDRQLILPERVDREYSFPDWIYPYITIERVDKSNITTALVMYDIHAYLKSFYATVPSIETLFINDELYNSELDLGSIDQLPNLKRLWVNADKLNLGTHTTLKSLALNIGNTMTLVDLGLIKFVSLTKLSFKSHCVSDIGPGLLPSSLTSLTLRPREIPPQDTFLSLKSLVKLKIFMATNEMDKDVDDRPCIDLSTLSNLKLLKVHYDNQDNDDHCIDLIVPTSLKILYLWCACLQIPSQCTMPQLEKLIVHQRILNGLKINLPLQCPSLNKLSIIDCKEMLLADIIIPSTVKKITIDKKSIVDNILVQVALPPMLTHLSIKGHSYEYIQRLPDSLVKLKQTFNSFKAPFSSLPRHLKKLSLQVQCDTDFVLPSGNLPNLETLNLFKMIGDFKIGAIPPTIKNLSISLNPKISPNGLSIFSIGPRIDGTADGQVSQWLPYNTTHLTCHLTNFQMGIDSKAVFRLDQVINHTNIRQ